MAALAVVPLCWWLCTESASEPQVAADDPAVQSLQAGQRRLGERDYAGAREAFTDLLRSAAPIPIGVRVRAGLLLAAAERLSGQPALGLAALRETEPHLAAAGAASRAMQRLRHVEASACYRALGLADLATAELDHLEALLDDATAAERQQAALAAIDLRMVRRDWSAARRRAERALQQAGDDPGQALELRLRAAISHAYEAKTAELAGIAAQLDAIVADPELSPVLLPYTTRQAARVWLRAGDVGRAAASVARAPEPDPKSFGEVAEHVALRARIAQAAAGDAATLSALRGQLDEAFAQLCAELRRQPVRAGGSAPFYDEARRDVLSVLLRLDRTQLAGRAAAAAAWQHLEQALSLGSVARRLGAEVATLDRVQQELVPTDGGVLAFVFAPCGGHLLAIDAESTLHVEFEVDAAFDADREFVRTALRQRPADPEAALAELAAAGGRLGTRLLPPPIRDRLARWRTVLLIGNEHHGSELWPALPFEDSWLCARRALVHASSATLALKLEQRAAARAERRVAGAARFALLADPLPGAAVRRQYAVEQVALDDAQRALLTDWIGAGQAKVWTGRAATRGALASVDVAAADLLCVFTHGVQAVERESYAGLMLAAEGDDDGVVFTDQLESLRLPPLCLLGACGMAAGPVRSGDDGATHFGGAAMIAGADSIVLATGEVPLGATTQLVGTMLRELAAGATAAEALRRARAVVAADRAHAHPWFFAGMRLVGIDTRLPR